MNLPFANDLQATNLNAIRHVDSFAGADLLSAEKIYRRGYGVQWLAQARRQQWYCIYPQTQRIPMSTGNPPTPASAPPIAVTASASMSVAVRVLCQFTAKRGDLDLRFTPAPSAREGIAGHIMVASRRGGRDYQAEMPLEGTHEDLHVRGRADGYDSKARRLDECKTYRGDLARMPDNHRALHWAQAKMYGAMLCRKQQLRELRVALVYFDVDTEDETVVAEDFRADELQAFFEEHCALYGLWARSELEHREARNRRCLR